jgi:hypothetical protein
MHHGPGLISPSRNLSCLATICRLLPVIGRVSGGCWWLTDQASEAQFRVSCPVRVGWFLDYDRGTYRVCCVVSRYLHASVPWLDMWGSNPRLRILGVIHTHISQGFEPLTKSSRNNSPTNCTLCRKSMPRCTLIGHVGPQPPAAGDHSSTIGVWTPDQGFNNPQTAVP